MTQEEHRKHSDAKSKITYAGLGVRHLQMACMCGAMVALFIARSSMGVAVLAMTDTKRLNDTNISIYDWDKNTQALILSSFYWGYVTMQIPAGMLAIKFGGKPIMMVALLASGLVCLLLPSLTVIGDWPFVCACRVVMGLTQACLFPASHTMLGRWLPDNEKTFLTGFVYGGTQIGTIIGLPLSGFLADTTMGWKLIFYVMSGLLFITSALWYCFAANSPAEHRMVSQLERLYIQTGLNTSTKGQLRTPWMHIMRNKPFWAIVSAQLGCVVCYVLFFVDMPTYLEHGLQISLKGSATLSALPYVGMWIGNVGSASLCEWIYNKGWLSAVACRRTFNSISFVGIAIGFAILSFLGVENKNFAVVTLIASLTLSGFASAGFMVNHLDLSPNFAGVLCSLANFVANIGSLLTPLCTSFILRNDARDTSRWRIVFLTTAALSLITNVLFFTFGSTERQDWDHPDFLDRQNNDAEELKSVLNENGKETMEKR